MESTHGSSDLQGSAARAPGKTFRVSDHLPAIVGDAGEAVNETAGTDEFWHEAKVGLTLEMANKFIQDTRHLLMKCGTITKV
ncbi:hypothetical protein BGE01nite_52290 [Brevifollis gellanilyticus]|uniref:Uncharacterized protein n=1 Tax=Brevifollis gellanilyticus TaxID=748831 RepID=A0A512MGS9_9BACT|nr:hypothetical protein BGE01nite_52290 [Brevifollis gellanilyticus]